ncbi:hypothetical protein NIES2101_13365 [Calothrix sp. HK-06]|nr:hypothetical protein NIES2101_13365 [Calothrix sp. HK-06]
MKLRRIAELLISKSAITCFCLVVVQQVIAASSSIWLKHLSEDLYSGNSLWTNIILYMASLTLPYIPGGLALMAIAFWQQESLKKFVNYFIKNNKNQPFFWNNKNEKDAKISLLSNEGQQTISSFIQYLYALFSRLLNAAFNIIVLSYIVEPNFIYGYFISILLGAIVMNRFSDKLENIATKAQDARVNLGKTLLSAWDNVVLGNRYSFQSWLSQFNTAFFESKHFNTRSTIYQTSISIGIAILTMLPCMSIAVYSLLVHSADKAFATTVIVTLPRLFMVLNFTYDLLDLLTEFPVHKSRLKGIIENVVTPITHNIDDRVNWSKLKFISNNSALQLNSLQETLPLIEKPGRITIRGENGTGKSTVLLLIQHELLSRSFYLPAQHHLSFNSIKTGCSTGETLKLHMQEIFNQVEADCILLDEWDANLDKSNQSEISQLIDQLAQNKTVVEVRHR